MSENLNGNLSVRAFVSTSKMDWTASPSGTVRRKRVHRVGPLEAGQVTSVVRYEKNATFPGHEHPDGEEILVLDGVFSDEHGDWPAGSYLLNPEGVSHAPYSQTGCTLFVKLRQYPGAQRQHLALNTHEMPWVTESRVGTNRKLLYSQDAFEDATELQQWPRGLSLVEQEYPKGVEIYVIKGNFEDEYGKYIAGDWLRLPKAFCHSPNSESGCLLYIKHGGFKYLATS
ncbi:MAG: cupin domain-containing protein [Pseudomonadota bacterium]